MDIPAIRSGYPSTNTRPNQSVGAKVKKGLSISRQPLLRLFSLTIVMCFFKHHIFYFHQTNL